MEGFVEAGDLVVRILAENPDQPGLRIDIVDLSSRDNCKGNRPGFAAGTASLPFFQRLTMQTAMWVMQTLGRAHSVDVGAKRYVDVLLNEDHFESGVWWGSKKGLTGKLADQKEHWPEIIGSEAAQNNADTVIHSFL